MRTELRLLLFAGACALSIAVRAGEDADLQVVGEAVGEMVTGEFMISTAVDGECGKFAPESFRLTREVMRQKIELVIEAMPTDSREQIRAQLDRSEFKDQLAAFKTKGIDDTLAMVRSKGAEPAFSCGYVFGFLSGSILRFDRALARAARQLGK